MSKTNFTKVEQALAEGMSRIERSKLDAQVQNVPDTDVALLKEQRLKQHALKTSLDWLWKRDKELFTKLQTDPAVAQRLVEAKELLSTDDKQLLASLFTHAQEIKDALEKETGIESNDSLVEQQRQQHITRRFNVDDRWLPLQ